MKTIILILFLSTLVLADDGKEKTWGAGAFPIIGYGPETSWVFGGTGVFYHNPDPTNENQQLDELQLTANYSMKKQYSFFIEADIYPRGNYYNIKGSIGIEEYPTDFYGIGGDTPDEIKESYKPVYVPFEAGFLINVLNKIYIGPVYESEYYNIKETESGGQLDSGYISGGETMYSSGFGADLVYKSSRGGLYHREGTIAEFRAAFFSDYFYGATTFQTMNLDIRQYFSLFSRCVLALQLQCERVTGDAPFYYLPSLGGSKLLRGYESGRYIAHNMIAGQAELRFPVFRRFGGVVFAGAGEVAEDINSFGTNVREAGGIGMRFALEKNQKINLRFDMTYNSDGEIHKYIKIKEAF